MRAPVLLRRAVPPPQPCLLQPPLPGLATSAPLPFACLHLRFRTTGNQFHNRVR